MKNLLVGQSGGPTAAINSSLAGVYGKAKECGIDKVYGMRHGIDGFLKNRYIDLSDYIKSADDLELLKRTPAAFLGSCRFKLPDFENAPEIYETIFKKLDELEVKYFLYIGGNDSMDTIKKLSQYGKSVGSDIAFVGVPKTIDNDLAITDHTPGFGSAAKFVASTIKEIRRDSSAYDIKSVTIVEVMGRDAGWLTSAAVLAKDGNSKGADLVYLPEKPFDTTEFLSRVKDLTNERGNVVIAVSEGVRNREGKYICDTASQSAGTDAFGHSALGGTAYVLAGLVKNILGIKCRGIELSTLQRSAAHILSGCDMAEAFEAGEKAVSCAFDGMSGIMITFERVSDSPYSLKTSFADVNIIANEVRSVPAEWILPDGLMDEDAVKRYLAPLIAGEYYPIMKDGIPQHLVIK